MAVVIETYSSATSASTVASASCSKPSGTSAGDLLIAVISLGAPGSAPVAASGWEYLPSNPVGSLRETAVLWKLAGGSEPASYTFTFNASDRYAVAILRLTGADQTTPLNAVSPQVTGSDVASVVLPSLTTTVDGCLYLGLLGIAYPATVSVTSADLTIAFSDVDNGSGSSSGHRQVAAGYDGLGSAGSTGTRTMSLASSRYWDAYAIAIAPAAGGGPSPISGATSKTLDGVTAAASGKVTLRGTATRTLAALAATGTGKLAAKGTTTRTLANLASSTAGKLALKGATTRTLADATVAATGKAALAAALNTTLGPATIVAAAKVALSASVRKTLGPVTATAAAKLALTGAAAPTLAPVTSTATARLALRATLAATLEALTLVAAGQEPEEFASAGALVQTLAGLTAAATGRLALKGVAAATLASASLVAAGTNTKRGALARTLAHTGLTATSTLAVRAVLAGTLDGLSGTAMGKVATHAALSATLAGLTSATASRLALRGQLTATLDGIALVAVIGQTVVLMFPTDPDFISVVGVVNRISDVAAANRNAAVDPIERMSTAPAVSR